MGSSSMARSTDPSVQSPSEVTGTKWNGFLFFNLTSTEENPNGKE